MGSVIRHGVILKDDIKYDYNIDEENNKHKLLMNLDHLNKGGDENYNIIEFKTIWRIKNENN